MYQLKFSELPHGGDFYEPRNQRGSCSVEAAADFDRLRDVIHDQLCGEEPKPSRGETGVGIACDFWGSGSVLAKIAGRWHFVEFHAEDFPALADFLKFEHPEDRDDATPSAREAYLSHFNSQAEAVEFESSALSIGRDFLPQCALDVLDWRGPSDAYWDWLTLQKQGVPS